jgi:hypothetical protein
MDQISSEIVKVKVRKIEGKNVITHQGQTRGSGGSAHDPRGSRGLCPWGGGGGAKPPSILGSRKHGYRHRDSGSIWGTVMSAGRKRAQRAAASDTSSPSSSRSPGSRGVREDELAAVGSQGSFHRSPRKHYSHKRNCCSAACEESRRQCDRIPRNSGQAID